MSRGRYSYWDAYSAFIFSLTASVVLLIISSPVLAAKPLVAVMDFEARGVSQNTALSVSDYARTVIFRTGKFTVVNREDMNALLKEVKFQQSGCTTEVCAAEIGQMLNAQKIFVGSVGAVGNTYVLTLKFVDVESGATEKIDSEKGIRTEEGLMEAVETVMGRLVGFGTVGDTVNRPIGAMDIYFVRRSLDKVQKVEGVLVRGDKEVLAVECSVEGQTIHPSFDEIRYLEMNDRNTNTGRVSFFNGHWASFRVSDYDLQYVEEYEVAGFQKEKVTKLPFKELKVVIFDKTEARRNQASIFASKGQSGISVQDFELASKFFKDALKFDSQNEDAKTGLQLLKNAGEIHIFSSPTGAQLRIDGKPMGKTPLTIRALPGEHTVEIVAEKHKPSKLKFTLKPRKTFRKMVDLERKMGRLEVTTKPPAQIIINGKNKGQTPFNSELPTGEVLVELKRSSYKSVTLVVEVSEGPAQVRRIKLSRLLSKKQKVGRVLLVSGLGFGVSTLLASLSANKAWKKTETLNDDYLNAGYDDVEDKYNSTQGQYDTYLNKKSLSYALLGTTVVTTLGGWLLNRNHDKSDSKVGAD